MNELPAGVAPPLHLLEEGGGRLWLWGLGLLLGLAWLWWLRRRRKESRGSAGEVSAPAPPSAATPQPDAIDALLERVVDHGDFRRGCHELAGLVRPSLPGALTHTARELSGRTNRRVSDFLARLEQLQFGRRPPDRTLFESICRWAKAALLHPEAGEP